MSMTPHAFLSRALERWPTFGVEHAFLARLNARAIEAGALVDLEPEDFYLACAGLKGVKEAVAELERRVRSEFEALRRFNLPTVQLEEVRQNLFSSLLVAVPPGAPRLSRYSGIGPLNRWLGVAATRDVISWLRKNKRTPASDDESLLGSLEAQGDDSELSYLKDRYRGQFSAAFKSAIRSLDVRERNLLRQHFLDELTVDELSAIYGVHRATVHRWMANARKALLERTREELRRVLGIKPSEVDNVMRLIQSRLDVSASIFLSAQRAQA